MTKKKKKINIPARIKSDNLLLNNAILMRFIKDTSIDDFGKTIDLFNILNRSIYIEKIDEETNFKILNFIKFWNKCDEEENIPIEKREPIKINIDTEGGYLTSAFSIIDAILLSKTPIWTINIGRAYSGGFLIFIVGSKRIAHPYSSFLFHEGSGTISGDANKVQNQADFYKKQREKIKEITLKYTSIPETIYEKYSNDHWYLFADEAIKFNIADKISTEIET